MRWSDATTLQFVRTYLKHECLWNPADKFYRSSSRREEAYGQISSDFEQSTGTIISIAEVKQKIKNLRTTYASTVHKILERSNPTSIYEPPLVWFKEMDECLKNIPTKRHCFMSQEICDEEEHSQWNDLLDINDDSVNGPQLTDEENTQSIEYQQSTVRQKNYKKKIKSYSPKEYFIEEKQYSSLREDEFDIYGKYIATQLRKMDLQKALKIQLEIQNLISKARMTNV